MRVEVAHCHLLARLMAADGVMTRAERAILNEAMERLSLSAGEREQVIHFEGQDNLQGAIAEMSQAARQRVRDEVVAAALTDGQVGPLELKAVEEITLALGL